MPASISAEGKLVCCQRPNISQNLKSTNSIFFDLINFKTYPPLEAQIAAISDDIAYNNHKQYHLILLIFELLKMDTY